MAKLHFHLVARTSTNQYRHTSQTLAPPHFTITPAPPHTLAPPYMMWRKLLQVLDWAISLVSFSTALQTKPANN